jgi:asparagine synthase (glutamine-hydrolysing)
MAVSLEARVPFLDHRVVEYAATVPSQLRLNGNHTKYILKRAMRDILPQEILTRGKEGFSIPIKNWLKNELRSLMTDTLTEDRIRQDGFFEPDYISKLMKEHLNGVENHSHRLWALIMFHQWYDIYMKN